MESNYRSLQSNYLLSDYKIESVLGQGTFGITYLAIDVMLNRKFAIKEYYPREFAYRDESNKIKASGSKEDIETFKWGLERFLEEARILARFVEPNIVAVRRFFEANGTAYLVMDYCEGVALDEFIKVNGPLNKNQVDKILFPLLDGLEKVHKSNFLHRDIKPANIFIRADGSPVLLDFGAARQEIFSHSKSITSIATPGYAAFEQYSSNGNQGPWTDIYGLAATMYRAITGRKPNDSPERMLTDKLEPLFTKYRGSLPDSYLISLDKAMSLRPEARPQTIKIWREEFNFTNPIVIEKIEPRLDQKIELAKSLNRNLVGNGKAKTNNKIYYFLGSLISLFLIIIFINFNKDPNKLSEVVVSSPPTKPIPIPTPNSSSLANSQLSKLFGVWTNINDCSAYTMTIKSSNSGLGEIQLDFTNNKYSLYKIISFSSTSPKRFSLVTEKNDQKYENEFELKSDGSLQLVRNVQTVPKKKIIVINGKDFETEEAIESFKRCS